MTLLEPFRIINALNAGVNLHWPEVRFWEVASGIRATRK